MIHKCIKKPVGHYTELSKSAFNHYVFAFPFSILTYPLHHSQELWMQFIRYYSPTHPSHSFHSSCPSIHSYLHFIRSFYSYSYSEWSMQVMGVDRIVWGAMLGARKLFLLPTRTSVSIGWSGRCRRTPPCITRQNYINRLGTCLINNKNKYISGYSINFSQV